MKILMSGSSGLIGSHLQKALMEAGYFVVRLVRSKDQVTDDAIFWDPDKGTIDIDDLSGFDAVVNLAGENLAKRWTKKEKKEILESRINSTKTLVNALGLLSARPKTLINASAVGFYGDRGDVLCSEDTPNGDGFLAEVCSQWEEAAAPAKDMGIRTVLLRTGIVLSPEGGALAKMLTPFKIGLGGVLGSGKQYISWVAIDDIVSIILFILTRKNLTGPVNAVAPRAVTNTELTKTLGKVLNRPTILPVPAFALRMVLGREMADEMLLSSTRVEPKKLMGEGYSFKYPHLEEALKHMLKK